MLNEELRNDREIALAAVQRNGLALQYLGETLRKDRTIAFEAIWQNRAALSLAKEEIRNEWVASFERPCSDGHTSIYFNYGILRQFETIRHSLSRNPNQ